MAVHACRQRLLLRGDGGADGAPAAAAAAARRAGNVRLGNWVAGPADRPVALCAGAAPARIRRGWLVPGGGNLLVPAHAGQDQPRRAAATDTALWARHSCGDPLLLGSCGIACCDRRMLLKVFAGRAVYSEPVKKILTSCCLLYGVTNYELRICLKRRLRIISTVKIVSVKHFGASRVTRLNLIGVDDDMSSTLGDSS